LQDPDALLPLAFEPDPFHACCSPKGAVMRGRDR
jgi:hypothetical protein